MSVAALLLKQFSQFDTWPEESLERLAGHLSLRRLARRQLALGPEELGRKVAWVAEGAVWLVDQGQDEREAVLGRFGPGEMFGELHAFGPASHLPPNLGYVTAAPGTVVVASRDMLWELLGEQASLGQQMTRLLAGRMADFFRWRAILSLSAAPDRVVAVLTALADGEGSGACLPPGTTQMEIAAYANTTRETVTRVMQRLQAAGAARRDGQQWLIDVTMLGQAGHALVHGE